MRSYSQDLRERVLRALDRGDRPSEIARRFEVSREWVYDVKSRFEKEGLRHSLRVGGHRVSCVAPMEEEIRDWIKEPPDLTLAELCGKIAEQGISIKPSGLWNQLNKWGLRLKKTRHAGEQAREDVQAARAEWKENQPALDVSKLVFLDETGVSTNMTRTHGRAPVGERCVDSVPPGDWKTTTFVAGLRVDAVTAPLVLDGPMDGEAFRVYVRDVLCPTLTPGDLVIADHLSAHKVAGIREIIEAAGATFRFLPPYSPDLNPIEMFFSKTEGRAEKSGPPDC